MTLELDEVIKNLNNATPNGLTLEIYDEDGQPHLYIGTDSCSGAEYPIQSVAEIGEMVVYYLLNYFTGLDESEEDDEG